MAGINYVGEAGIEELDVRDLIAMKDANEILNNANVVPLKKSTKSEEVVKKTELPKNGVYCNDPENIIIM